MPVKSVSADEIVSSNVELSESDQKIIAERLEALRKLYEEDVKAQYKLELLLCGRRPTLVSAHLPVTGVLSFWENGRRTHGGGDSKVYICPGNAVKKNGCFAVIPSVLNNQGLHVCPKCHSAWKSEAVVGEVLGNHTLTDWAKLLGIYFRRLEGSCDIYLKLAKGDLFQVSEQEQNRQLHGERLAALRAGRLRDRAIYPFANILKDLSGGADLNARLRSMLFS